MRTNCNRIIIFENFSVYFNGTFQSAQQVDDYLEEFCEPISGNIIEFTEYYRVRDNNTKSTPYIVILRQDELVGQFFKGF